LKSKSGEFIGDVLIGNPDYPLKELSLKGNELEEYGVRRIIVAATKNRNLRKLKLGTISDFGLQLLTDELINTNLEKIEFEESKEHPFSERVKEAFIEKSEEFRTVVKCKGEGMEYYNDQKKDEEKGYSKYKKRNLVLAQKSLVKEVVKNLEQKKNPQKIAIRKYFKNTFGDLLNDAMYELTRKQEKFPDQEEFFSVQGSASFVAHFLLSNLPEHEVEGLKEEKTAKENKTETEV